MTLKSTSIGLPASVRSLLAHIAIGQSVSFVKPMEPGDSQAPTKMLRHLSAVVAQAAHGQRYEYESFSALTSRQCPVVGVVATRVE